MALNIWNKTRDLEDLGRREDTTESTRMAQTPRRLDKREKVDLDMIELGTINLEEEGKVEDLATYEKMWEASALAHLINTPQPFWVGLFLEVISRSQDKAVELLGTLRGDVSADWTWVDNSIHTTNLRLEDIEAQGMYHFPLFKEHIW